MAILFDGPVTPDALTTFVREVPSPPDQVLNLILPDRILNKNTVDLSELTRTNRTARFRAFDARLHVSERDTISSKQVKLPPLSSSISVGEFERLQLEFARLGGTNTGAIIDADLRRRDEPDPRGPCPHGAGAWRRPHRRQVHPCR
jgi:hypothetical protein